MTKSKLTNATAICTSGNCCNLSHLASCKTPTGLTPEYQARGSMAPHYEQTHRLVWVTHCCIYDLVYLCGCGLAMLRIPPVYNSESGDFYTRSSASSIGVRRLIVLKTTFDANVSPIQVVREGHTLHFGPARAPLRTGTIVTLRDAFFKWPVRRKAANEVRVPVEVS